MKFLDRWLRDYRINVALKEAPADPAAVFDIGCDDGYLLAKVGNESTRRDGCEPLVAETVTTGSGTIHAGFFPDALAEPGSYEPHSYDVVTALAVFEHVDQATLQASSPVIANMLTRRGRLIATVPHPLVDMILHVLIFLRLIDGQEAHQHHGFDPRTLAAELPDLVLVKKKRFQLGLNYLFVFERRA